MTRESIANKITGEENIFRTIQTDTRLNLQAGSIYDNRGKVESWSINSKYAEFYTETERDYEYTFYCDNVPCHAVDYENEEETEVLNACNENEMEVLVLPSVKMEIVSVSSDDDMKEMGYYEVILKVID